MYIGVDVNVVISALASPDPTDDLPALLASINALQRTDFPARVAALADEIAHTRPHVIGLQEADDVLIDLGSSYPRVDLHFVPMLRAELAERGLHYDVAADLTNFTVSPFPGVRVADHDVMLVDASRVTLGPSVVIQPYAVNVGTIARGITIARGWVQVDARIGGTTVTVASTHLEAIGPPALRTAQAQQLASALAAAPLAILLGDFNDVPASPAHRIITGAGFVDSWESLRQREPGFTCCELADLSNAAALLSQRIDYVFARGFGESGAHLKGRIKLVGERASDRVPGLFYPVWPSDHAGVVARLRTPSA